MTAPAVAVTCGLCWSPLTRNADGDLVDDLDSSTCGGLYDECPACQDGEQHPHQPVTSTQADEPDEPAADARPPVQPIRLRATFQSPWSDYPERIGQPFELLREIDPAEPGHEYAREEVGPMYRIRFKDGTEVTAWPEEIDADESWQPESGGTG